MSTTSDLRLALCRAICTRLAHCTPEVKRAFAVTLDTEGGFTTMADNRLAELAYEVGVDDETVTRIVATESASRRPDGVLFLCRACNDNRWLVDDDGRWSRCQACNVVTEPDEFVREGQ